MPYQIKRPAKPKPGLAVTRICLVSLGRDRGKGIDGCPRRGETCYSSSSKSCVIVGASTSPRRASVGPDSILSRLNVVDHRVGVPEGGERKKGPSRRMELGRCFPTTARVARVSSFDNYSLPNDQVIASSFRISEQRPRGAICNLGHFPNHTHAGKE